MFPRKDTDMRIRLMKIEDYDSVHQLWCTTPGMGMRSLDDSVEGIRQFLFRNPETCYVAEYEEDMAGVILCGHDGRRGYIYHTAVKETYRKQGIGTALVNRVLEALKQQKINKAALVVYSTNELGNQFWEGLGFEMRDDLIYRNISLNLDNN